jgi:hypothetical protein
MKYGLPPMAPAPARSFITAEMIEPLDGVFVGAAPGMFWRINPP